MLYAIPAARCCGTREGDGAVYIETRHCPPGTPGCQPLSFFLIDPAVPVDVQALGITPVGVTFVPAPHPDRDPETWDGEDPAVRDDPTQTIWHIFDWVGSEYTVLDFYMEARFLGISRRLARTADFAKITPHSRLILLHKQAAVTNYHDLWTPTRVPLCSCPKGRADHPRLTPGNTGEQAVVDMLAAMGDGPRWKTELHQQTQATEPFCDQFWWHNLDRKGLGALDQVVRNPDDPAGWATVSRRLPAGMRYTAWLRPDDWTPRYTDDPAAFLSVPIGRLAVTAGDGAEESLERASASEVLVEIVNN